MGYFRDDRGTAFELAPLDEPLDDADEPPLKPHGFELRDAPPFVDHRKEEPVHIAVREAELPLIGLPRPEIRRRLLFHDPRRDAESRCELPDLRFVEVAERIDRTCHVAEERAVAEQELRLVARPQDKSLFACGNIVEDDHPLARHDIPRTQPVIDAHRSQAGVHHRRDVHGLRRDRQSIQDELRIREALPAARPVRHQDRPDVFPAEGTDGQERSDGGIDASGESDDPPGKSRVACFVEKELFEKCPDN